MTALITKIRSQEVIYFKQEGRAPCHPKNVVEDRDR